MLRLLSQQVAGNRAYAHILSWCMADVYRPTVYGLVQLQVHISYLEIYNELGYDLLDPTREVQAMEDLPQVHSAL